MKEALRKKHNISNQRKRCIKRNKRRVNDTVRIFGINAAGIKSKIDSFDEIISKLKPQIWMVEETKLKPHENIKCDSLNDFQVF